MKISLSKAILQAVLIAAAGCILGAGVNAMSREPLVWIRVPAVVNDERWEQLTAEEVLLHIEEGTAILVDARDPNEFESGHILGAINLPEASFMDAFADYGEALPREVPIIVYCQGGLCDQSHAVLEQLGNFEFQSLLIYPGGWNEWKEKNYVSE